jgi:hypothetical protein
VEVFLEAERLVLPRLAEDDAGTPYELDDGPEVVHGASLSGKTTPYEEIRDRILPR